MQNIFPTIRYIFEHAHRTQALYQVAAVLTSVAVASAGGLLAGEYSSTCAQRCCTEQRKTSVLNNLSNFLKDLPTSLFLYVLTN
jgi:hypothetical protein